MRVGLDVTSVVSGATGVAHYTQMLWTELRKRKDVDVSAFAVGRGAPLARPVRHVRVPLRIVHAMWRTIRWPDESWLAGQVDVVHSMDLIPPPSRKPLVVTIHDAFAITHPHLVSRRAERLQLRQVADAQRARIVVTTCQATAATLRELVPGIQDRVVVAPLAPRETSKVAVPPLVDEPYVLAVGSITPRKGFGVLARAASIIGAQCPRVIIVGPDGWRAVDVRNEVQRNDRFGRVRFIGTASDAQLAVLYRHATLVCHPSLAEGFGLVCLEALAEGKALVSSDLPSVREIADGAAEFVPVGDPEALAGALAGLLASPQRRDELGERGRAVAGRYSWDQTTNLVVEAYRRAIRAPAP